MDAVEQPPAVGLPPGPHDRYRRRHPGIGVRARPPEVVQRTQLATGEMVIDSSAVVKKAGLQPAAAGTQRPAAERAGKAW